MTSFGFVEYGWGTEQEVGQGWGYIRAVSLRGPRFDWVWRREAFVIVKNFRVKNLWLWGIEGIAEVFLHHKSASDVPEDRTPDIWFIKQPNLSLSLSLSLSASLSLSPLDQVSQCVFKVTGCLYWRVAARSNQKDKKTQNVPFFAPHRAWTRALRGYHGDSAPDGHALLVGQGHSAFPVTAPVTNFYYGGSNGLPLPCNKGSLA